MTMSRWVGGRVRSSLGELDIGLFFDGLKSAYRDNFVAVNRHDSGASGFGIKQLQVRARLRDFDEPSSFELLDNLLSCQAWSFGCHANFITVSVQPRL